MKKICIIGLGNMGQAMFDILSIKKLFDVQGCGHKDNVNVIAKEAEVLIIAVKPQSFSELADSINLDLKDKLVISIMAGISIEKIKEKLKVTKVIRALPSLPLKVGQSLTIWKSSLEANDQEKILVKDILGGLGEEFELDTEKQIELVGIINGCGPAFFAYLGEKMSNFLATHGFDKDKAAKISKQTLIGTGELLKQSSWTLTELREKVSSEGGITEAAVKNFDDNNLGDIFQKGFIAAKIRTEEFNK